MCLRTLNMQRLYEILRSTRYLLPRDDYGKTLGVITNSCQLMRLETELKNITCTSSDMESILVTIKAIYNLLPRNNCEISGLIVSDEINNILNTCRIPGRYSALGVGPYDLALDRAIRNNDLKSVHKLLALGADIDGYGTGISHLSVAIEVGNFEIVKFLLENGANPNKRYCSQTPLQQASNHGIIRIYRLLKQYNAGL